MTMRAGNRLLPISLLPEVPLRMTQWAVLERVLCS